MELSFRGQYDQPTMQRALLIVNRPSRFGFLWRGGILALLGGAFIYTLVDYFQSGGQTGIQAIRMFVAFATWVFILARPYFSIRKIAAQFEGKNVLVQGIMDRLGLRLNPGQAEKFYEWERFADWKTSDELVVLVMDDNNIFPFRQGFFHNEGDWKQFMLLIEDRIQKVK